MGRGEAKRTAIEPMALPPLGRRPRENIVPYTPERAPKALAGLVHRVLKPPSVGEVISKDNEGSCLRLRL